MSAKSIIQKLEDSDLIRLFLQFVQVFHLQYQKSNKQISYKCYEATWVIGQTRAAGYGRTQSEAYKHALRNLLEILIEDPQYTQFFIETLTTSNQYQLKNSRPSLKKHSIARNPSSKTQGHEPIHFPGDKYVKTNNPKICSKDKQPSNKQKVIGKMYESYSKLNVAGPLSPSHPIVHSLQHQPSSSSKQLLQPQNKLTSSVSVYRTKNQSQNQESYPPNDKFVQPSRKQSQSQSHHSKVNLSTSQQKIIKSNYQTKCQNVHGDKDTSSSHQLRKALQRLSELETYLSRVNQENEVLKEQLNQVDARSSEQYNHKQNTEKSQQCQDLSDLNNNVNKPKVPKLKLQILPNYHKRSEKSLNDSLMAAYNEKRNPSVKKMAC